MDTPPGHCGNLRKDLGSGRRGPDSWDSKSTSEPKSNPPSPNPGPGGAAFRLLALLYSRSK